MAEEAWIGDDARPHLFEAEATVTSSVNHLEVATLKVGPFGTPMFGYSWARVLKCIQPTSKFPCHKQSSHKSGIRNHPSIS